MFQWQILTVGHLSRNKFWGEDEKQGYRLPLASCTLLRGEHENILVDPSLPMDQMAEALFDNSGLKPGDITTVFSTHYHFDHQVSLGAFQHARWFMPEGDLVYLLAHLNEVKGIWPKLDENTAKAILPAAGELVPGVTLVPLPGHTEGICGLMLKVPEGRMLLTGDAVMTREFYASGEPYFFGWNTQRAAESIRSIRGTADIIVPGHGQPFYAKAYE